jgi:hypothetical protein
MTFFRMVSLIAIVPDSECRMPTLMVSAACARVTRNDAANGTEAIVFSQERRVSFIRVILARLGAVKAVPGSARSKRPDAIQLDHPRAATREPSVKNAMGPARPGAPPETMPNSAPFA